MRPSPAESNKRFLAFQSTHPRGVRLGGRRSVTRPLLISIHAPTWGATRPCRATQVPYDISIHAPTWGATHCQLQWRRDHSHFNPRTHVGCDEALWVAAWILPKFQSTHPRGVRLMSLVRPGSSLSISIHAPTWGATAIKDCCCQTQQFQSTHPRGVRLCPSKANRAYIGFQSTHPRGVRQTQQNIIRMGYEFQSTHPRGVRRPCRHILRSIMPNFNPRTHVGCDRKNGKRAQSNEISIHAPTWGATESSELLEPLCAISIHAPTWGATLYTLAGFGQYVFQSTHPRGVRPAERLMLLVDESSFQSTHPRGVRLCRTLPIESLRVFQSTHPRGVRQDDKPLPPLP